MLYTLKNDRLTVVINDLGAELVSVKSDGVEYLWQGDPEYWKGQAINLFPIVGKLYNGEYTYKNKTYKMTNHGFLRNSVLSAEQISDSEVNFILTENDETLKIYPFCFKLTISYTLSGNKLKALYTVENTGKDELIFAFGGHPGFNVPLNDEGVFEDWYLKFNDGIKSDRVLLSEATYLSDNLENYQFANGNKIPLEHNLFDNDAIILKNIDKVTLESEKSTRSVTVTCTNMKYVGFWHPIKPSPFVCIEPWSSLLDYESACDFTKKRDMTKLLPKKTETFTIDIEVN